MKNASTNIIIMGLLFGGTALAAGGGAHGDSAIPYRVILWQTVNLSVLLVAMFFLLRKSIVASFANKKEIFLSAAKKSQALREAAEKELLDYQSQLQKLRSTAEESILRAKAESSSLRKQIVQEAEEHSARIRKESEEAIQVETKRAERQLREHLVVESIKLARNEIVGEMKNDDHQNLQKSFVENMKAVN